jgi:hypothetical protein
VKRGCDLLIVILKTRSKDRSLVSLDSSYKDSGWPKNEQKKKRPERTLFYALDSITSE